MKGIHSCDPPLNSKFLDLKVRFDGFFLSKAAAAAVIDSAKNVLCCSAKEGQGRRRPSEDQARQSILPWNTYILRPIPISNQIDDRIDHKRHCSTIFCKRDRSYSNL